MSYKPLPIIPERTMFDPYRIENVLESQVGGQHQIVEMYGSQSWRVTAYFDNIDLAMSKDISTFLLFNHVFLMAHYNRLEPEGEALGNPQITQPFQAGNTLSTSGWAPNQTALKAGDMIALPGHVLKTVGEDVIPDAQGEADIKIWPPLRRPPTLGALTVRNAMGRFVVVNRPQPIEDQARGPLEFEAWEVVT